MRLHRAIFTAVAIGAAAACADRATGPATGASGDLGADAGGPAGAVYTSTNSAAGNAVVAYSRAADGTLSFRASYPTGGVGTGAGLGSQGALTFARGGFVVVVNAGSDDITAFFRTSSGGLVLADRAPSGGDRPISVTARGDFVYVLNAGGEGNITGFHLSTSGDLTMIPGSTRPLSQAGGADPAQVAFSHHGVLVVTEKATNRIDTYVVGPDGLASGPMVHPSAGATPFGFSLDRRDRIVVSEAAGGAPGASSASSYQVHADGSLTLRSGAVPTGQTAACWVVITDNDRFAYTTNTGSNNLSSYRIRRSGTIELRESSAAPSDATPIDAALSRGGVQYLYALNAGSGTITAFRVSASDGTLSPLGAQASGLPAGSVGLLAR
jgi:6-phosphogluconolactonase (cycloisomerase 2 family)